MSHLTHSNLVMATRAVAAGDIIASSGVSTAKQYFATNRVIPPQLAPLDAVWNLRAFGTVKSAVSVAPTIMVNLEIDRSVVIPIAAVFAPGLNLSNLKWHMEAVLTRGDGTLIVNGYVGMQLSATGALVLMPLVTTGIYAVDWAQQHTIEISMAFSAIGTGNSMTLEQGLVLEHRFI